MNSLFAAVAVASLTVLSSGCGNSSRAGTSSATPEVPRTSSVKPLPPEYRVLADNLALEMKPSASDFKDNEEVAQLISEAHANILALRAIQSTDSDITYIAARGQAAATEAINCFERLSSLPKPPDFSTLLISSFIGGFYTGTTGDPSGLAMGLGSSIDAEEKQKAIIVEVQATLAALDRLDAAHMLLPTVAVKYAASPSNETGRFIVDIDESWGAYGPNDWFCIFNGGLELQDCTIQVQLFGSGGQVRKNVHFVRHWPANSWMYSRYELGQEIVGRQAGSTTVLGIQKADVSIWSPQLTTSFAYDYQGAEKDKDIANWCSKIKLTGRYQPFTKGVLWDTQRGCYFTLDGFPHVPRCQAHVTFRKGAQSKGWYWELDHWKAGEEKHFGTSEGQLTFDPYTIDLTLVFPETSYKHNNTMTVDK